MEAHSGVSDLVRHRFVSLGRRRWWVPVVLMVLGLLIGAFVLPQDHTSSGAIALRDQPGLTVAAELQDLRLSLPRASASELVERMSAKAGTDEMLAGRDARLFVVADPSVSGLRITATSRSAADADAAVQAAVTYVRRLRNDEGNAIVGKVGPMLNDRRNRLQTRVDDLTTQLASETDAGTRTGLAIERASIGVQIEKVNAAAALLATTDEDREGVQITALRTAREFGANGVFGSAALGYAVLLGFLGVIGLAIKARFSTAIFTRDDVRAVGGRVRYLTEVTAGEPARDLTALLCRIAAERPGPVLVAFAGRATNPDLLDQLRSDLTIGAAQEIVVASGPALLASNEVLGHAQDASAVFIVVEKGRVTARELTSALQSFSDLGRDVDGVILDGLAR